MTLNSSRLPESGCSPFSIFYLPNFSKSSSVYYHVTLASCVVTSLLAPIAVVGNALIMAAIWKNPSLRTPSYVLLAGLAFTDFCTGLLTQPVYVTYRLADLTGNFKMLCIAGPAAESVGYYLSSLTGIVMTIMAVERWLHMSRRNLLTVRRVIILYITFAVLLLFVGVARITLQEFFNVLIPLFLLAAAACVAVTAFSYFKVFRIIRHHQCQVQPNENAIKIEKYKKSIFTILYILAVFVLTYMPYLCCVLVFFVWQNFGKSFLAALTACTTVVISSSSVNPLLYYWGIKEIRDGVSSMVRKLCCNDNGVE